MLRITTEKGAEATTFKLEGRLAGPWIAELERAWRTLPTEQLSTRIIVELYDVTFIDAEGRKLLEQMYVHGVRFKAYGCLMNSIIEDIGRNYDRLR